MILVSLMVVVALVALTWSPLLSRATTPAGRLYGTPWAMWLPAGGVILASCVRGWLGLAVVLVIVRGLIAGHELALWTSIYFALGAGLLTVARSAPQAWIRWTLLGSLTLEIAVSFVVRGGTLAQPAFLGAATAAVLPLAPWWLLPVFLAGVARSHSYLAVLACVAGLLARFPSWWRPILAWAILGAILYGLVAAYRPASTLYRLDVWRAGLADMGPAAWLVGYGPGGWGTRMWRYEGPSGQVFTAAHNEPLQWLYETGLIGMMVLVSWMRQAVSVMRQSPPMWRAAFASVTVLACGLQVFHLPTLAPVMVLVLGGALHTEGGIRA